MPEIKISALDLAPVTPTGTEVFAVVQGSTTHKTTIDSLKPALVDNLSTGAPTWDVNGNLTAGYNIIAGGNHDGKVALTINDNYGNANLTFNHTDGIPDVSGSSARIAVSVDSNQEVMDFQLKGSVTAGSALSLTSVLKLYDDGIQLLKATTCLVPTQNTHVARKDYVDTALNLKATTASVTAVSQSLTNHLAAGHPTIHAALSHTHPISNITNLQTSLDGKIGEAEINTTHFTFTNSTLSLKTILEGQIGTGEVTPGKLSAGAPNWNNVGTLTIVGSVFTGGEEVAVNYWGSGDRNAYIDFHSQGAVGDNGYDYDARLFRYPGVDGKFELSNKGTGPITVDREIAEITDDKSIVTKEYVVASLSRRGHFAKATESESGKHSSVCPQYSDAFCYINDEDTVVVGGTGNSVKRTGGGTSSGDTHRSTFMLPDDEKADKLYISYYNMHVIAKSGKSYSTGYGYSAASISSTSSDHSSAEFYSWIRSFCESDNCKMSKIVQSGDISSHNSYALDQQGYFWGHGIGNSGPLANGTVRHSNQETAADVGPTSIIGKRESLANSETATAGVPYNLASNRRYKAHIMNPMLDSNSDITTFDSVATSLLKVTDATHIGSWNGNDHYDTVAILGENKRVYVAGYGGKGQAGDGSKTHDNKHWVNVHTTSNAPLENIVKIYSGGEDHYTYFLAIDENYDVWAWGDNGGKQLGLGSSASSQISKATRIWDASAKGYRANYIITNNAGSGGGNAGIFVVSHQTNNGTETDKRFWIANNSSPSSGVLTQLTHTVFNTTTYSIQELYYSNGNTNNMAYVLVRNKTTNKLELWSAGYNGHGGLGYQNPTNSADFTNKSSNFNIESHRVNFNSDLLEKVVAIHPSRQYNTGENTHIHLSDGRIFSCGYLRWSFDKIGHSSKYSYKFTPIPMD
jgi:hypothetical protein